MKYAPILENVEYSFIVISSQFTLAQKVVVPVWVSSMGQIDVFKNYYDQKKPKEIITQKMWFPNV